MLYFANRIPEGNASISEAEMKLTGNTDKSEKKIPALRKETEFIESYNRVREFAITISSVSIVHIYLHIQW